MKYFLSLIFIITLNLHVSSQILEPIKWKFNVTQIDNTTFEVHLKATIKSGWHVYSQIQPKNAIAEPLHINFIKNNLIILEGKPKEVGKLSKVFDKTLGIGAYQYSDNLDIVQTIKLKKRGKTILKGFVTFQTCNDQQCLPSQDESFQILLN